MKAKGFLGLLGVLILAALLALPLGARAEMYVEGYLGGVQAANAPLHQVTGASNQYITSTITSEVPGRLDPAVLGGVKLGTWFVKEGFLGYNYPDWMQYLGFYLDFNFHRLNFRNQIINSTHTVTFPKGGGFSGFGKGSLWSEGTVATLAFMFAGRYGFLGDSEVPFGRLQPYVAVGPGILFTSQRANSFIPMVAAACATGSPAPIGKDEDSDATICLAAEAGLRWMCLKNVSVDLSFKYRFAQPRFTYAKVEPITQLPTTIGLNPTYNLFSGQIGVAYHF
jgi:opacity protein-like surface antigen